MKCVITTINPPTAAIEKWHDIFGNNLIVVGDKKTPDNWGYKGARFIPYSDDENCNSYAPTNHYARKNLGYIEAIKHGAEFIYDSDDDNAPNEKWAIREGQCNNATIVSCGGWFNVYGHLHDAIWPRGFSLKHISNVFDYGFSNGSVISPIQQGLANGDTDTDAIFRLIMPEEVEFFEKKSLSLFKTWCPFNSQSTWWFPEAYPLLYLPVNASFRMTDIWRSFVAQRCLWETGKGVVFHSPAEVYQERNPHDLLKDFEDEIPGYLNNDKIAETLSALKLNGDIFDNIRSCYQSIVDIGVLPEMEMRSLENWIKDVKELWKH